MRKPCPVLQPARSCGASCALSTAPRNYVYDYASGKTALINYAVNGGGSGSADDLDSDTAATVTLYGTEEEGEHPGFSVVSVNGSDFDLALWEDWGDSDSDHHYGTVHSQDLN